GDLHNYISNFFFKFPWYQKLEILSYIAQGLDKIHKKKFIHRDLNSGNILVDDPNSGRDRKEIYGVIPYIAPEIFNSFGMIMWEMTTGQKPFSDRNHDEYLILDILNPYIDLMEKCWDANLLNRPSAMNINDSIWSIRNNKEIKFPENIIHTPTKKINPQAIYTSRPLSSLVNTALRMKLNYSALT
ncbi:25738_t:CDS:2, partial [Racocetra persica]